MPLPPPDPSLTLGVTALIALAIFLTSSCATAPKPQPRPEPVHGVASWYGQEFAGRTTANGEIFDPLLLTAAHRTLPFGTLIDVRNAKSGQSVRVRINDRGPYIGGRMIDLSYAAAQQIGLIEPGSGVVDLTIVALGNGDREPPAPYVVTIPDVKPLPLPAAVTASEPPSTIPVVVDNVQVVQERRGVETRLQVSADGRKLEEVPVKPAAASQRMASKFVVQVGAFAQESNAKLLQAQLDHLGERSYIERADLYRVRIGPFETRDQAIRTRARLETAGLSAIVVVQ